jgi:putative peptidoglycan lipid II flippase
MSRRIAANDVEGAHRAQSRTMALTVALAAPFFIAFVTMPELIVAGLFMRGKFTAGDAIAAGDVLAAYGAGLMALVLIASARASFQSRGDTATPMKIALAALAANVALKVALFQPLGAVGLATATSVGLWINLGALIALAIALEFIDFDEVFTKTLGATFIACAILTFVALFGRVPALALGAHFGSQANLVALIVLGLAGAVAYGAALVGTLHVMGITKGNLRARKR